MARDIAMGTTTDAAAPEMKEPMKSRIPATALPT
jgi:hypothetical protein